MVFQFGISAILIIAVIVFQRQMDYIQKTNLGYERAALSNPVKSLRSD